jgi:hypothetical protein
MIIWHLVLVMVIVLVASITWRKTSPHRKLSWNKSIGPSPLHGEKQIQYVLRRILFTFACALVLSVPLFFANSPPDEGTSFNGNESVVDLILWVFFSPLFLMAVFLLAGYMLKAALLLVFEVFGRRCSFDKVADKFIPHRNLNN